MCCLGFVTVFLTQTGYKMMLISNSRIFMALRMDLAAMEYKNFKEYTTMGFPVLYVKLIEEMCF